MFYEDEVKIDYSKSKSKMESKINLFNPSIIQKFPSQVKLEFTYQNNNKEVNHLNPISQNGSEHEDLQDDK